MANISGALRYDAARTSESSPNMQGIANVSIVLQDTASGAMIAVNTDANGSYSFTNVPDGNYRIVEAYGQTAVASPGDFSAATVGAAVSAKFPPINAVNNPPPTATNLDALTPTTMLVTVSGSDLTNLDILNGPVKYTPIDSILDNNVTVYPNNLITNANNGDFGSLPAGSNTNVGAGAAAPYPEIGTDFTYTQPDPSVVSPLDGEYTVQNVMTNAWPQFGNNTWWRVADHTTGNETGRMMVVNGFNPGAVVFQQQLDVKPFTYYLFSTWILNMSKSTTITDPKMGVEVLSADGSVLYKSTLGELIPMNADQPEWKQIGTLIDTKDNSRITVKFTSQGPAEIGNDYVIDDIALQEIKIAMYMPQKSASTAVSNVGDTVTYTVTTINTGTYPLTNVTVKDLVPDGFSFVPGTVTINGVTNQAADPAAGFSLPDIAGSATNTVTFTAKADKVPTVNPTVNTADLSYDYSPVNGGISNRFTNTSNPVQVLVSEPADLSVVKTADKTSAKAGDVITYTLLVTNNGPGTAKTVSLDDALPQGVMNAEYSIDGGGTWRTWNGNYAAGDMANAATLTVLLRGTVAAGASGAVTNTATVQSPTNDPNQSNNGSTTSTVIEVIPPSADLKVSVTPDKTSVKPGDAIAYTITVGNDGPDTAQDVKLNNAVPPGLTSAQYSTDGGVTWQPWNGTPINLGDMPNGGTGTVLLKGTVDPNTSGTLTNTATASSGTNDPNTSNNSNTTEIPVTESADISLTKTAGAASVVAGDVLTYTLAVINNGPQTAKDVTVNDTVPSAITNPEYSIDGGAAWQPWSGTYAAGGMTNGATLTILLRGTVAAGTTGGITNTATVQSPTDDPNPNNNGGTTSTPVGDVTLSADVKVSVTPDKTSVKPGDPLTYTITVGNDGPNPAQNVKLNNSVPQGLTSPQYSTDGGVTWKPWDGSPVNLGNIPNGGTSTVLVKGTVDPNASAPLENTAAVGSETFDPNTSNNNGTIETPVVESADVSLVKNIVSASAAVGDVVTYTLKVTNNGPQTAKNVKVNDNVPSAITNPEYSVDGGSTWRTWSGTYAAGDMTNGAALTILIRGTVAVGTTGGIINSATAESPTNDPNPNNNGSTTSTTVSAVIQKADVKVSVIPSQSTVNPGDPLNFTITVGNDGPDAAKNVVLNDIVPPGFASPQYSTDGGTTWKPWDGSPVTIGDIVNGGSKVVLIKGTVDPNASGTLHNTATVGGETFDPNTNNNNAVTEVKVNGSADLSMTKTADKTSVKQGDVITYTLTAKNNGPSAAENVVLNDATPTGLSNAEYSTDGGVTWQAWNGSYTAASLAGGAAISLKIRGTVTADASGTIENTATASSNTPDPNPNNNSGKTNTPVVVSVSSADLKMQKTADKTSVLDKETLTYTLAVTNAGPDSAKSVVITDSEPSALSSPQYSTDGGATWKPWGGSVQVGDVSSGAVLKIQIRGTINTQSKVQMSNTAKVESPTNDPNPNDNISTVTVNVNMPPLGCEQARNRIISSIAMEELSLSHILNAEGEKLQYVFGTLKGSPSPTATIDDVLKVNDSVIKTMQTAMQMEMFLLNKLEDALKACE